MIHPASTIRFPRQAFTLIELLIVVAIIGVLAALLLPSLERARDASKRASCLSSIRQVGVATLLYAEENNGYIDGTDNHASDVASPAWYIAVSNRLGSNRLLVPRQQGGIGCAGMDLRDQRDWTYSVNWMFGAWPGYYTPPMIRRALPESKRPSLTFLVSEGWYPINYPAYLLGQTASGIGTWDGYPRHRGNGLNFFFVDGHAQWLKARPGYMQGGYYVDPESDWNRWGDLNGVPYPYATEWWPLNVWVSSYCVLYGQ